MSTCVDFNQNRASCIYCRCMMNLIDYDRTHQCWNCGQEVAMHRKEITLAEALKQYFAVEPRY